MRTQSASIFSWLVAVLWLFAVSAPGPVLAATDSKGTEHFFAILPNYTNNPNLSLYITSEEDAQGTVQIAGLNFVKPFTVQANAVIKVDIPLATSNLPNNTKSQLGVKVISDREVTVYGINRIQASTDAFLSLPTDALGLKYLVMSYFGHSSGVYPSEFSVMGVYDNTQVTITPSAAANGRPAGQPFTITLNSNETFLLQGSGANDLTGSSIEASAPVSVSAGVKCANVPKNVTFCDHITEMMPPVSTWGKSFLTVPLATRKKGDVFRVLASQDNTVVKLNGATVATLNRAAYYETVITARSVIEASAPVLVAQYSPGQSFDGVISDPFMMLVPPAEQFLNHYGFSTLGADVGFANSFVNVVAPSSDIAGIQLDGTAVNPALFQPIGQSGFSGAQIQVGPGQHTIHGSVKFGIYVYGFGNFDSYGYPGGMAFDLINPQGDHYLPNINLMSMGETLNVVATDSEDINANGTLDTGEDLDGNGDVGRRTEDLNNNQILDSGEDTNGDGILDRDTGIFKIELAPGSKNIRLITDGFVPGSLQTNFKVVLINPAEIGRGVLVVTDGAGNKAEKPLLLSVKPLLTNVRVLSTLSTQGIDLDASSFMKTPDRVETLAGKTILEWRYEYIAVDQIENLDYEVVLRNPKPNEQRLVTQTLELFYTDVNGNEVRTELGEQRVNVLPSIFAITVATDKQNYTAHEPVLITAGVKNLSDYTATAPVKFLVKDAEGDLVADLGIKDAVDLVAGEQRPLPAPAFNTGTLLQGEYIVYAQLLDSSGLPTLVAVTSFVIGQNPNAPALDGALSVDKPVYAAWDTVNIASRVINNSPNVILKPTVVEITVTTPEGQEIFNKTASLTELVPNAQRDLQYTLNLADAAGGDYPVLMAVKDAGNGTTLLTRAAVFHVERQAIQAISGKVEASPVQVYQGEPVSCTETVQNKSASLLSSVLLSSELVSADSQQTLNTQSRTVDLAANGNLPETRSVATGNLPVGTYACVLRANVGGQSVQLGAALFDVLEPPIRINASLEAGNHGRVLVLLDPGTGNDPLGPNHIPTMGVQRPYLEKLLYDAGWSYTIVTDADTFTRELRSGGYVTYLLLSESVKLAETVQQELREAVNRGEGLVEAGGHDQRQGRIDEALGLKFTGKYPRMTGISIDAGGFTPVGQLPLQLADKTLRFTLDGATALGRFIKDGQITTGLSLAERRYGLGRSVHAGYDLLAEASLPGADTRHGQLLLGALSRVHPEPLVPYALSVYPLTLKLANTGIATPGRVVVNISANVSVIDAGGATNSNGQLVWGFNLAKNATVDYTVWVRLPDSPVTFNATVESGSVGNYKIQKELTLQVETLTANDLKAALDGIAPLTANSYKQARTALQQAQTQSVAGNWLASLDALRTAADRLITIGTVEAGTIRLNTDRALRSVAIKTVTP